MNLEMTFIVIIIIIIIIIIILIIIKMKRMVIKDNFKDDYKKINKQ